LTGHVCCLVNAGSRRGGIDGCGYTHTFYTYINTYVTEIYAYMYTHKCTYIYIYVYVYAYKYIHICMYVYIYIYIYVHMYVVSRGAKERWR